jgi:hypothetical protein
MHNDVPSRHKDQVQTKKIKTVKGEIDDT